MAYKENNLVCNFYRKTNMEDIVIDFNQNDYSDAIACPIPSLIHQSQMEQIMKLVKKLYQKAQNVKKTKEAFSVKHDTISIFASRGAGKTTFLLTTLEQIREKYDRIVCLNIIDPSAIENKQHPFINVIASIQEEVERYFLANNLYDYKKEDFEQKKDFEDCYKKLLKGLPVIDGIGKGNAYDDWNDEEFISIKGMEKAELSNKLSQLFHKYVKKALNLIDKDCFVISFDDIDTDFKKGFQLLEVIRKYLTTPQIITILTGDLELYGKLVRKANWQCFSQDFLKKELEYANRTKAEFAGMINQLENQYLVKILKPENRIHLKTIYENRTESNYDIKIKFSNSEIKSINQCYEYILERTGLTSNNTKIKNTLTQYIEGLPTRIQIRLLTLVNNNINSYKEENNHIASEIMDIFWNDIIQKSSNAKALLNKDQYYVIEMLKFLLQAKALYTGSSFMPLTNDMTLNKALLAISAQFNEQVQNKPFMIFDFWLRICYVQFVTEQMENDQKANEIHEFLNYTGLSANDDLTKSICLSHAYCNYIFKQNPFFSNKTFPGTVILNEFEPLNTEITNQQLSILPIVGSKNENLDETTYLSIYKLLAIIRDILFYKKEYEEEHNFFFSLTQKDLIDNLHLQLNKFIQYRYYIEPISKEKRPSTQAQIDQEKVDDLFLYLDDDGRALKMIVKKIIVWCDLFKKDNNYSPQLLSRIFTRFFFTTNNIDQSKRYTNAGDLLHAYIIALLNAILIEESIDNNIPNLNLNTLGNIDNIFIHNVSTFHNNNYNTQCNLFQWISKCPLLTLFINPYMSNILEHFENQQMSSEQLKYDRFLMAQAAINEQNRDCEKQLKSLQEAQNWLNKLKQYKDILLDIDIIQSANENQNKYFSNNTLLQQRKKRDEIEDFLTTTIISLPKDKFNLSINMDKDEYIAMKYQITLFIQHLKEKQGKIQAQLDNIKDSIKNIKDFVKSEYAKRQKDSLTYNYLRKIKIKQFEKNAYVPNFDYEFFD